MQRISPHLSLLMLIDKKKISLTLLSTTISRLRERIIIGALYIGNITRMMMMKMLLMRIMMLLMRIMRMIVMALLPLFVLALRII